MNRKRKIQLLQSITEDLVGDAADVFLLFVDLSGSTQYKKDCISHGLPDLFWIQRQLFFLQQAAKVVQQRGGIVVKTIGDELFAYFPSTIDAEEVMECAIELSHAFRRLRAFQGPSRLEAKVSVDFGPTYNGSIDNMPKFDPIGSAVDRCARLNSIAGPNQIVFSDQFLAAAQSGRPTKSLKVKFHYKTLIRDLKGIGKTPCHFVSLGHVRRKR